jgi:hypothetical protein
MENNFVDGNTRAGTIGGTLLVVFLNISCFEILHTAVLAGVGAVVSFGVSVILKYLAKLLRSKRR